MKFKYKTPLLAQIVIYILLCVQTAVIFLAISKIFGWFTFNNNNLWLDILEIVISVIVIVASIFLLTTKYIVDKEKIKVKFGFFDLTSGRFYINRIASIVTDSKTNKLFINIQEKNGEPSIIEIAIYANSFDGFITAITAVNPSIETLVN
ncbi:MAG: hypothetical protein RR248_03705 [Clostridia bacterium]